MSKAINAHVVDYIYNSLRHEAVLLTGAQRSEPWGKIVAMASFAAYLPGDLDAAQQQQHHHHPPAPAHPPQPSPATSHGG